MPSTKKVAAVATQPILAPDRKIVYDQLEVRQYSTAVAKGPLTVRMMKKLLRWETEKEYQQRKVAEAIAAGDANAKPEHFLFGDGVRMEDGFVQPIHCRDLAGNKVVCWNNSNNRSFDQKWSDEITHTVLHGQWAGPHTMSGESINGETIRISRYGEVLSGQHQMTACIAANDKLQAERASLGREEADKKYPAWTGCEECFLETILVTGMSSDPRVLMTVDYSKPRTIADVFHTSPRFHDRSPQERRELCRMLAAATDLLWTRTATQGYRTHVEMVAFLERHKRLMKCVEHIYPLNREDYGRPLSQLRLSSGQCAALMYLMGCGSQKTTDYSDEYRHEEPPSEKHLDWSLWGHAQTFWDGVTESDDFRPVRTALGRLKDSTPQDQQNQGLGGCGPEKFAILANAWERWREHIGGGRAFDDADLARGGLLHLTYSDLDDRGDKLPNGEVKLVNTADFGGIDCQEVRGKPRSDPPAPTPDEIWGSRDGTDGMVDKLREEAAKRRR